MLTSTESRSSRHDNRYCNNRIHFSSRARTSSETRLLEHSGHSQCFEFRIAYESTL